MVIKLISNLCLTIGFFVLIFLVVPQTVYAAAGDVWIYSSSNTVGTNSTFTLEVHTDTDTENLAAYQLLITFDPALVNVDTLQGTDGVEAGTDGFISAVNTDNTNGVIKVNGFNVAGTGPGSNLQVLIIHFNSLSSTGQSAIDLTVDILANEIGVPIGTPNGINGTITVADNNPPSAFQLLYPTDEQTGLGTTVEFSWKKSTDPDGKPVTYDLYYCDDPNPENCAAVGVVAETSFQLPTMKRYYAGILLFGIVVAGGISRRRRIVLLMIGMIILSGMISVSCGDKKKDISISNEGNEDTSGGKKGESTPSDEIRYTVSVFNTGTTYFWKVIAKDGDGEETESEVWSFTTQY